MRWWSSFAEGGKRKEKRKKIKTFIFFFVVESGQPIVPKTFRNSKLFQRLFRKDSRIRSKTSNFFKSPLSVAPRTWCFYAWSSRRIWCLCKCNSPLSRDARSETISLPWSFPRRDVTESENQWNETLLCRRSSLKKRFLKERTSLRSKKRIQRWR